VNRKLLRSSRTWLLVGLFIGVLFALESVAVHAFFTTHFPGGNDFYSRWAGARALLLEGRDPYSLEVTKEIQVVKGIDPTLEGKGSFSSPLHVLFVFWPLVYVPFDWAQAIWMVALQWVAVATVIGLLILEQWRPSLAGLTGLFLGTLLFYPVARSIILGQFTLHVTLFLVAALWALQRGRDGWAGVWLAATSIKPQMVVFVAPWLVLWAVRRRRWRLVGGLLAVGGVLLLASLALFPRWPISFLEDVRRYSGVAGGRNPLVILMDLVWPGGPEPVRYGLAGLLMLVMLWAWRRGWRDGGEFFSRATHWTIVISLLVPFQTGTTNHVTLLIPLFAWLRGALTRWGRWRALIVVSGLHVALWALFLGTVKGDWENPVMFLPLPLLCLAVLVGIEINHWWATPPSPADAGEGTGRRVARPSGFDGA
jgi:hypothetical protein